MHTAFTASRHQIVGEAAGVEEVDIRGAVQVPVVRRSDKIEVSVCVAGSPPTRWSTAGRWTGSAPSSQRDAADLADRYRQPM
jgi:hypothetical protein